MTIKRNPVCKYSLFKKAEMHTRAEIEDGNSQDNESNAKLNSLLFLGLPMDVKVQEIEDLISWKEEVQDIRLVRSHAFKTVSAEVRLKDKDADLYEIKECLDGTILHDFEVLVEIVEIEDMSRPCVDSSSCIRAKTRHEMTKDELDKEMDEYNAQRKSQRS